METPHNASPVRVIEEVDGIDRLEPLEAYQSQLVDLVRARLAAGVNALDVTGAVADANDSLTRRLLGLAESHLGPPPCRYVWLALGSHGRREQVLSSDQDSAIAYEATSPHEAAATDEYFAALAALVVDALARAGIPLCGGGYMATNWHRPLDEFGRLFRGWVEQPQPEALLKAEVFLDVRACHGELSPDELIRILLVGGSRGPFRTQMARAAVTFRPSDRLVRPPARPRLHPGRQTRRDGGHCAAGQALCARRGLGRAQHRASATGRRGRRHTELGHRRGPDRRLPPPHRAAAAPPDPAGGRERARGQPGVPRPVDDRATDDAAHRAADGTRHPGDHRSAFRNLYGDVKEARR